MAGRGFLVPEKEPTLSKRNVGRLIGAWAVTIRACILLQVGA